MGANGAQPGDQGGQADGARLLSSLGGYFYYGISHNLRGGFL
jgi:hypothetical protein